MNTRIKEVREAKGLSQADFAEMLNLKRNSISLIEVGKRNPSDRTILDICNTFSVSEEWLRTGKGKMFIETPSSTMEQLKKEFELDDFSYNLVYRYLKLGVEQRQTVRDFFYNVVETGIMDEDLFGDVPKTPEDLEKEFRRSNQNGTKKRARCKTTRPLLKKLPDQQVYLRPSVEP